MLPTFIESFEILLYFLLWHWRAIVIARVLGVLEHVVDDQSLTELRLDMLARTSLSMSARSDFQIERAIDLVMRKRISTLLPVSLVYMHIETHLVLPTIHEGKDRSITVSLCTRSMSLCRLYLLRTVDTTEVGRHYACCFSSLIIDLCIEVLVFCGFACARLWFGWRLGTMWRSPVYYRGALCKEVESACCK